MNPSAFPAQYAPRPKLGQVVKSGEFVIAAAFLDHAHIYSQCQGLIEAGAVLKWVFDPDPIKVDAFRAKHPQVSVARSLDEILADPAVHLVTTAAIACERGPIGCRVMDAGKDYFTDKPPFTTFEQLESARHCVVRTGRKYMVAYSERLHTECGMYATDLVAAGVIGRVIQVLGLGPHRLYKANRPSWFFERHQYGGILCDIGCHKIEQFLTYTGATDATVLHAIVANYSNPDTPGLQDYGEVNLLGNNGATNYVRVDWFTPDGLSTFGDVRTIILGTKGFIELRQYVDIARERSGDHVYVVDGTGEYHFNVSGQVGYRYFGELILDCLNRSEKAMTQAHAFKAAELSLKAQAAARVLNTSGYAAEPL